MKTYKVQQLNLATREIGTVLRTEDLQAALARMNRPGSSYIRVVEVRGGRKPRVIASKGAAALEVQ